MKAQVAVFSWVALLGCALVMSETAQAQVKHTQGRARFNELKSNARKSNVEQYQSGTRFKQPDNGRFEIQSVDNFDPGKPPFQCGIAVWFQLENGKYVNPTLHRWSPKEKFHVWIEPAVPVSISLHQNYPEDRPASRQVYPDSRYPETFRDFAAGERAKLPVAFVMDNDLRDEIMSMVVVRCDSGSLPIHSSGSSTASGNNAGTSGPGGTFRMTEQLQTRFNDESNSKGTINGKNSRFIIVGPDQGNCPEISANPDDVQFFMFGDGYHHQFQLTLKK